MSAPRPLANALPWIVASIWALAFFVFLGLSRHFGQFLPTCHMKRFFNVPCPTCRGTRAGLALWRGELIEAFSWNPLVATFLISAPLIAIASWLGAFRNFRPTTGFWRCLAFTLVVVLLANWFYVLKMGG